MSVRRNTFKRKTQKKHTSRSLKRGNDPHKEITNYIDGSHKSDLAEKRLASRINDIITRDSALVNAKESVANDTLLARASYYNLERVVATLLSKSNVNVNEIGKKGLHSNHPAVVYAIRQGNDRVATMLLDHPKIDVTSLGDNNSGDNILMTACLYNRVDVVRHLLDVNADFEVKVKGKTVKYINVQDKLGYTALMHATNSGLVEIAELILEFGAAHNFDLKSDLKSSYGQTANDIAILKADEDNEEDPEKFYIISDMIKEYDMNFDKRVVETIRLSLHRLPHTNYDVNNEILSYHLPRKKKK